MIPDRPRKSSSGEWLIIAIAVAPLLYLLLVPPVLVIALKSGPTGARYSSTPLSCPAPRWLEPHQNVYQLLTFQPIIGWPLAKYLDTWWHMIP